MKSECFSCNYILSDEDLSQLQVTTSIDEDGQCNASDVTCPKCGVELTLGNVGNANGSILHEETQDLKPVAFAHFQLIRILGRGGFGTVWLARDSQLDRQVAIKLPLRKSDESFDLLREARTAAKLRHPNVVSVYEVGSHEDQPFIVCEYIEGLTLREWMRQSRVGTLPFGRVCSLIEAISEGLEHAHETGVVHRDMKPANVLMDANERPLVTDFGLAKNVNVEESISSRSRIVGTIAYMAPEQADVSIDVVDHRADIYAVGVTLYEMLTGERPFRGNVQALIAQKLQEDPQPLRKLRPTIPRDLETICLKCLQRSPARRYQSMRELIEELKRFQTGMPILARPVSKVEHARRWAIRNPVISGLLLAFVSVLITGLLSTSFFWLQAARQSDIANRSLYASQIRLTGESFFAGDLYATRRALEKLSTSALAPYRGFEWRYLKKQVGSILCNVDHGKTILDVAISRDGQWFATVSDDRMAKIWKADSGEVTREIAAELGRWQSVAISKRDNRLALGSKDGTIHVFDAIDDADEVASIVKHGPSVNHLRFSRDGKWLFSAGASGAIRKWSVPDLELSNEFPTGKMGCSDFDVSGRGEHLAVVDEGGFLRVWQTESKRMEVLIETGVDLRSVALNDDGSRVATGSYSGELRLYDLPSQMPVPGENRIQKTVWMSGLEFIGQSNILAIAAGSGDVIIYDSDRDQENRRYQACGSINATLTVSSNGKRIVVGDRNGQAFSLVTSDLASPARQQLTQPVRETHCLADGRLLLQMDDGSVWWTRIQDRAEELVHEASDVAWRNDAGKLARPIIAIDDRREVVAIADPSSEVSIWRINEDKPTETLRVNYKRIVDLALDSSADHMVVSVLGGPLLHYESLREVNGEVPSPVEVPLPQGVLAPRQLHWDSDSGLVFAGFGDGMVRCYDSHAKRWQSVEMHCDSYPASLDTVDGRLYIGSRGGFLYCCESETLELLWKVKVCAVQLNAIAAIPQSETVAVVGRRGILHFCDSISGEERLTLYSDREVQAFFVDASPNGETVVMGDLLGRVQSMEGPR